MLPVRFDPFRELSSFRRDIDDLFRRTFGLGRSEADLFSPVVNTYTKEGHFCIDAEVPGVDRENLELHVDGQVLTLRGERKDTQETKEENYILKESHYGSFLRRIELPQGVDTDKIEASYDKGILRVRMPVEEKKLAGRRIEITGEGEKKTGEGTQIH
jgi:HSP20 family protein